MINDKAKGVSLLELVQLPPKIKAIAKKDHSFQIVKDGEQPEGQSAKLPKPMKFDIISFDSKDFVKFKHKAFVTNHMSEAMHLFEDVNRVRTSNSVSILTSGKNLLKHKGHLKSEKMKKLIDKAVKNKFLDKKYAKESKNALKGQESHNI